MVLLFLAVIWAAVLVPAIVRRHLEQRTSDSIGAFHRHLVVLERTGPSLVSPAHRLCGPRDLVGSARPPVVPLAGTAFDVGPATGPGRAGVVAVAAASGAFARRTRKRRRDILATMLCATGALVVFGIVPHLHVLWWLAAVSALATAGYVTLLVQFRKAAAEREVKVVYLPRAATTPTVTLRRRAVN